ncbi:VCBS repeat-containing protein [Nocardiopsis algeriensis]|uniref:FG-GAP repeat protein n=1 Tax=Nocardiopsis algeriensis TaxID=1478215 RepID=A0A841INZ8_9ACTN|nr:hypothetical protein [Nocardiopsis algeriensis]
MISPGPALSPLRPALLVCVLVLSACGREPSLPDEASSGDGPEEVREYDEVPVPESEGSGVPDDVNGDGFADLLFMSRYDPDAEDGEGAPRLVIVYGSSDGPDPATRTVWPPDSVRPASVSPTGGGAGTADLDGDGFADIPVGGSPPGILWGGPTGPDPGADPTLLDLPAQAEGEYEPAASEVGDFDGDGAADVVLAEVDEWGVEQGTRLTVLHGPFDRDGTPQRSARRTLETPVRELVPEPPRADGGPSALLVRHPDDGEQPRNTLLVTGPGDPQGWGVVELLGGALAAFGDVDGDGETDLALADSGTRNNEPGFETEPPEVDQRVNVYAGPFTEATDPVSVALPGTETSASFALRTMAACDLDGDGPAELWIGLAGRGVDTVADLGDGPQVQDTGPLVRQGPETGPLGSEGRWERTARVHACGDYDADGSGELALAYDHGYASPVRWWIVGSGGEDETSFDSAGFTE